MSLLLRGRHQEIQKRFSLSTSYVMHSCYIVAILLGWKVLVKSNYFVIKLIYETKTVELFTRTQSINKKLLSNRIFMFFPENPLLNYLLALRVA